MSTKKVKSENLVNEIMKILIEYGDDIDEIVKDETNSDIKQAKQELVTISPRSQHVVKLSGGTIVHPRRICTILDYWDEK